MRGSIVWGRYEWNGSLLSPNWGLSQSAAGSNRDALAPLGDKEILRPGYGWLIARSGAVHRVSRVGSLQRGQACGRLCPCHSVYNGRAFPLNVGPHHRIHVVELHGLSHYNGCCELSIQDQSK